MYCRPFQLRLSACGFKDVKHRFSKSEMDVYAVVSIIGGAKKQELKTSVQMGCGTRPYWFHLFKFTLDDDALNEDRLQVEIKLLVSNRNILLGKVVLSAKQLLMQSGMARLTVAGFRIFYLTTPRARGKYKGEVHLNYKFGDKYWIEPEPEPEPESEPVDQDDEMLTGR